MTPYPLRRYGGYEPLSAEECTTFVLRAHEGKNLGAIARIMHRSPRRSVGKGAAPQRRPLLRLDHLHSFCRNTRSESDKGSPSCALSNTSPQRAGFDPPERRGCLSGSGAGLAASGGFFTAGLGFALTGGSLGVDRIAGLGLVTGGAGGVWRLASLSTGSLLAGRTGTGDGCSLSAVDSGASAG